jgi:cytochrome o ubiquinol oxidase subunit II
MTKIRQKKGQPRIGIRILLAFAAFAFVIAMLLQNNNIALFHSRGLIAHDERNLMLVTVAIILVVAIPTLITFYFFAWKYRESNTKPQRNTAASSNKMLVPAIWLVPTTLAVILASIMWPATHRLEPRKSLTSNVKPLTIQVVSMRWKWVFIYPAQHIATVNFVQIPENTPVQFELTADEAPMSSFWIPNLSGQLYSMTGHMNQLNIMADTLGDYTGSSAEINGTGFAGMKFTTRVSPKDAFDFWVSEVKLSGNVLNDSEYQRLLKPSQDNPATFYSSADTDLYNKVLMKYMEPSGSHEHAMNMEM